MMDEIGVRRFRVERSLRGEVARIYVEVPGRSRWRLVWTSKQADRGYHPGWRDMSRLLDIEGFVAALDGSATASPQAQRRLR